MSSADVLLTAGPATSTGTLLAEAAVRRGLRVARTSDGLAGQSVHWYGGPLAARRVAARLGLGLLEPAEGWLAGLAQEWTGRRIELTTLAEAWALREPWFVKPPTDKQFPAAVYADGTLLPRTGERIGPETPVLLSEVVTFAAEYRLFVLDGEVVAESRYAVFGRLNVGPLAPEVRAFARELLAATADSLPSAVVVDVGLVHGVDGRDRWAVVEANMPWFAHSYAAEPDRVLDVVLRAAGPSARVGEADRRFLTG